MSTAVIVAIVAAVAAVLGTILPATRERSRLSILKRTTELTSLDPEAAANIRKLQLELTRQLLAHYAFEAWKTYLIVAGVAFTGGVIAIVLAFLLDPLTDGSNHEVFTVLTWVGALLILAAIGCGIASVAHHHSETKRRRDAEKAIG